MISDVMAVVAIVITLKIISVKQICTVHSVVILFPVFLVGDGGLLVSVILLLF